VLSNKKQVFLIEHLFLFTVVTIALNEALLKTNIEHNNHSSNRGETPIYLLIHQVNIAAIYFCKGFAVLPFS
jgi:hypothetical protein